MLARFNFTVCFLFSLLNFTIAQETEWDIADRNIVRVSPDSFPQLPDKIRVYLKGAGYSIPQSYLITARPHNVIQGSFKTVGQMDWAVLASKERISSILIFWNGSLDKVTSIAKEADKNYLQSIGSGAIAFSRTIEVIKKSIVLEQVKKAKGNHTVIKDHDGINDSFLDKASAIHYLSDGAWYNFQGAD